MSDGRMVAYKDYAKLEAQNKALIRRVKALEALEHSCICDEEQTPEVSNEDEASEEALAATGITLE